MATILVLNSGSSSLKFALVPVAGVGRRHVGQVAGLGGGRARLVTADGARELADDDHAAALDAVLDWLRAADLDTTVAAVGHRVVHGGETFSRSVLVDDAVEGAIAAIAHLAPLHNPANLAGIRAARTAFGDRPQVAVFDTAFHQTIPPHAHRYALPDALYHEHGVRRYGFHGSSHRYVAGRARALLGLPADDHGLVSAHLGNGCSTCAVRDGRSVDTSMGLTPLEGLVMGTRSGDVDPGLFAYLEQRLGWDAARTTAMLNREAGLSGLSGRTNDMRELLALRAGGDERAALAVAVFCHRLARSIAAMGASLARLDALVFTGGIGEHAAPVRAETLDRLRVLGLACDPARNAAHGAASGSRISPDGSVPVLVVATDEEAVIAADTAELAGLAAREEV